MSAKNSLMTSSLQNLGAKFLFFHALRDNHTVTIFNNARGAVCTRRNNANAAA